MLSREKLLQLEKPGRYTGGEVNAIYKEISPEITRFAFCFPDVYEIGMSHLGLQILYFFLNRRADVFCERAFMPWMDMVEILRTEDEPLFALESGDGLGAFDFLGFTLQYEMSYTNVLAMLDLAKIPLRASQRGENFPIICAGGPCATNPEPMADFVDFFYIGDGEASLDEIMDTYAMNKKSGGGKAKFLQKISTIAGVYVPAHFETTYNPDNTIASFKRRTQEGFAPLREDEAGPLVKRAFLPQLDFFPEKLIVPLIEATHARAVIELARGCGRGCRFCQAGFIYRPVRERSVGELLTQAEKILDATGYEEISLLSLSACDYKNFEELVDGLLKICEKKRVNISLPSTRLDALHVISKIKTLRTNSLTVAPEAGSQRLRDAINKGLTEDEILDGCFRAFKAGFDKIKLYFMGGLPGETDEDALAAVELSEKIVEKFYILANRNFLQNSSEVSVREQPPVRNESELFSFHEYSREHVSHDDTCPKIREQSPLPTRKRPVSVGVSTSCFVPKPFTPFQWAAQIAPDEFSHRQREAKAAVRKKQISYRYHDAKTAHIEGILARGDRRPGAAIEAAYRGGAIFDGWTEHFKYDVWLDAFAKTGVDPEFYTRERGADEILPWDFIDVGVKKNFLRREWERAVGTTGAVSEANVSRATGDTCQRRHIPSKPGAVFRSIKKRATDENLHRIVAYATFDNSPAYVAKKIEKYRSDPRLHFYGWVENGEILGICVYEIHADKVEIHLIAVDENFRGRGIGSKMITALWEKFAKTSAKIIEAETDDDAVNFYRKCGFTTREFFHETRGKRFACVLEKDF
ncbi:MAG: TIGR03960 family B12-binding radical SAM protein [Defluviitaleaceae bacterium]|nr:TIGR03960 family B12-binding radical SAM protein [Defluviitaleaceae bacterium]